MKFLLVCGIISNVTVAEVVELADALDSKSSGAHTPCGFDSRLRHQLKNQGFQSFELSGRPLNIDPVMQLDYALKGIPEEDTFFYCLLQYLLNNYIPLTVYNRMSP